MACSSLVGKICPRSPTPASLISSLVFFPATSLIPFLSVLRCLTDHLAKCLLVWMVRIWHKHFSTGHDPTEPLHHLSCWSASAPALPAQSSPLTPHVNSKIEITWAPWDRPFMCLSHFGGPSLIPAGSLCLRCAPRSLHLVPSDAPGVGSDDISGKPLLSPPAGWMSLPPLSERIDTQVTALLL